jgi:hypothetical protein
VATILWSPLSPLTEEIKERRKDGRTDGRKEERIEGWKDGRKEL